jgi:pSer/pThr/pTyr-binding forkhead associated (FHA) protein
MLLLRRLLRCLIVSVAIMSFLFLQDLSDPGRSPIGPLPSGQGFTIGRNETSDLSIQQAVVSAVHCKIFVRPSAAAASVGVCVTLTDLSSNGTFVNGVKVGKGKDAEVKVGDVIQIAKPRGNDQDYAARFKLLNILPSSSRRNSSLAPSNPTTPSKTINFPPPPPPPVTPNNSKSLLTPAPAPAAAAASPAPSAGESPFKSPIPKRARVSSPPPGTICTRCVTFPLREQELVCEQDALSSRLNDSVLQLTFKTRRLEELEKQHAVCGEKTTQLSDRCRILETQSETWEFKAAQFQSQLERVKAELTSVRTELTDTTKEKEELRVEVREWQEIAERNKLAVSHVQEQKRSLEMQVGELQEQLASCEVQMNKCGDFMTNLNQRNSELVMDKNSLIDKLHLLQQTHNSTLAVVAALRSIWDLGHRQLLKISEQPAADAEAAGAGAEDPAVVGAGAEDAAVVTAEAGAVAEDAGVAEVAVAKAADAVQWDESPAVMASEGGRRRESGGTQLAEEGECGEGLPDFLGMAGGTCGDLAGFFESAGGVQEI